MLGPNPKASVNTVKARVQNWSSGTLSLFFNSLNTKKCIFRKSYIMSDSQITPSVESQI